MRYILGLLAAFILPSLGLVGVVFGVDENDWLAQSYRYSHENHQGYPYSSNIEANNLFNTNASIVIGGQNSGAGLSDSVLVRAARFLMRIGVMLAIPILVYGAIKIALSFGDKTKAIEAVKQIGYMIGGLLLILFSVLIVLLLTSITRSSLDLFRGDLQG